MDFLSARNLSDIRPLAISERQVGACTQSSPVVSLYVGGNARKVPRTFANHLLEAFVSDPNTSLHLISIHLHS